MKKISLLFVLAMLLTGALWAQNCSAPRNLQAALHYPTWNSVRLSWQAAIDSTEQTLTWGTSTLGTRIGLSEGPVDITGAIRFETADLSNYTNHYLTAVSFMPGEELSACNYTIKIWRGGSHGSSYNSGTLVYSKAITEPLSVNTINTILLDSAIAINPSQELWIGVQCISTSTGECYPLGACSGTTVAGKGELIRMNNSWMTLTQGSLSNYNWILSGTVTEGSHIVDGYNITRDNVQMTANPVSALSWQDLITNGTYQYDVSAIYRNGCQSDPVSVTVTLSDNPCADCMDSVFVSNGNSETYRFPTNTYYGYSYTQQIYTAGEINRIAGDINCISFQYINPTPQNRNLKIYLGNTSKSVFETTSDWVSINEMSLVYDGIVNFNDAGPNHWLNIPLNQPFSWDGASNLVVAVWDSTAVYTTNSANTFLAHNASNRALYTQSTTTALDPEHSTIYGSYGSQRSNIRFMIGSVSSCPTPSHLAIHSITHESATISWTGNGGNNYELVAVPDGSTVQDETVINVNDTVYTLTGLNSNTSYTIYVRTNCASEASNWTFRSFATYCDPIVNLPFAENFDSTATTTLPDCWLATTTGNGTVSVGTFSTMSTDKCLSMYSSTSGDAYAILPGIDNSVMMNNLQIRFQLLKTSAAYGHLEVGVMEDPRDISTFTPIKTFDGSHLQGTNTWYDFIVYLNHYEGEGHFIAFRSPSDYTNYVYIDDIIVNTMAGCGTPSDFIVERTTGSAAQLSWRASELESDNVQYTLEYSIQGDDAWQTITTTNTYLLLSNLEQLTNYDVRLYVTCDNGSSDTLSESFLTGCLSGGDITIGSGTGTTVTTLPTHSFYNYSYTQQLYMANELNGANTFHSISFNASNITTPNRTLQIFLMATNATSLSSGWLAADSAKLVYTGSVTWQDGWNTINFDSLFNYDGISNLALIILDNTGSYSSTNTFYGTTGEARYVYQDAAAYNPLSMTSSGIHSTNRNIVTFGGACDSMAVCVPPLATVNNVTSNSASLTWAPGYQEASWDMDFRPESDTVWTPVGTLTSTNYLLNNLANSTSYFVRLRSNCDGTYSDYTNLSFTTFCDAWETLPFVEAFDEDTVSGNDVFPACWTRIYTATNAYPYISANYATSGEHSLYCYNGGSGYYSIAATPRLGDAIAMDSLMITFNLRSSSASYKLEVGVMSNPTDANSFTAITTVQTAGLNTWETKEIITRNYSGNGRYIAFKSPVGNSNMLYVDDVRIDYIPECVHISNLATANIDSSSATLTWTAGRDESEWEVVVIPTTNDSIDLDTCTSVFAYETSYLIENLTPSTNYTAFVRANCGDNHSSWMSVDFTTTQTPAFLPYVCDFEDSLHNWILVNGTGNNKWVVDTATNNGGTHALYVSNDNGVTNAYDGNNSCYIWAYRDIFFPACTNGYNLSFDWRGAGESNYDYMLVYFGEPTQPTAGTTFSVPAGVDCISENLNQSTNYQTFTAELPGQNNDGIRRLYFLWRNDASVQNDPAAAIDNISISMIQCPAPVNVYAYAIGIDSAILNWTEIGEATSWNLYYRTSGTSSWTTVNNVERPYVLTGLQQGTTYYFYVESSCGDNEHSAPSFTNNFTTLESCPAPTSVVVNNITANSFTVNWNASGDETEWTLSYKVATASSWTDVNVTTKPYTVTGLAGNTGYSVRVKANCGGNDASSWTSYSGTITTLEGPCPTPTDLQLVNVTETSATISWTQADNSASQWNIRYKKSNGGWVTDTISSNPYTLTNLEPGTAYIFRIRALCSSTSTSAYTSNFNFTTAAPDSTGINDWTINEQAITLYPNPASTYCTIHNAQFTIHQVEIYDVYGKLLQTIEATSNEVQVNIQGLAAGIYFARITTEKGIATKRFIKK